MKKIVFGHKNPDTDSICSTLAYALVYNSPNQEVEPYRLGKLNKETKYVLEHLNIEEPKLLEEITEEVEIVLVDHNERGQSFDDIENFNVVELYDHHRLANFETKVPINITIMPVGCTSTVLYYKFKNEGLQISTKVASLMLSAIISDTLLFKSPTCTNMDVEAAKKLSEISNLDSNIYGMEMLKAGTDLGDLTIDELLELDKKAFKTENGNYEVGQVNTVNIQSFIKDKDENIKKEILMKIEKKNLSAFMFIITDIVNSNSLAYVMGGKSTEIAQSFQKELIDHKIELPGVVSRKKQIVPFL